MKNDTKEEGLLQPKDNGPREKLRSYKKLIVVSIAVLIAVCVAAWAIGAYVTNTGIQNSILITSLKNTLELKQVKFHAELKKQAETGSSFTQNLVVDGEYKKGAGLSASAESTVIESGVKLTQKSRWVIDSANNTYVNLRSYGTETADDSSIDNTLAMEKMIKRIVDNNNRINKDEWAKYEKDSDLAHTYAFTGLQGCTLKAFYNTQSKSQAFQDLIKQLADNHLKMQKTASSSGTDTYTVTAMSDGYDKAGELYMNDELYKWLVDCGGDEYSATADSIGGSLKGLTVTIKVDTAEKLVSSLSIKSKGSFELNATLIPTDGVDILVPKKSAPVVTSSSLTLKVMKEQYPYDYKHLLEAAESTRGGGACTNFEEYREYLTPEVIKICEDAKKSN